MTDIARTRRRSRFWLYTPFVLLALLAAGWTGFWFVVRGRVAEAVDSALAREVERGRNWTCTDRRIEGFPFRIELRCATLALTSTRWGDAVKVETGPALAVGQIYTPGMVIMQVTGPARAALTEGRTLEVTWSRLEASLIHEGQQRFSMVATEPAATLTTPGLAVENWRAASLETHLRHNPTRPATDQAVDLAVTAKGTVLPVIDALLGTSDPGDIDLQATITQTEAFRLGFNPDALEAWRIGGGQIEVTKLLSTKGTARIEAGGRLLLDQTHRLSGQVQAGIAGIDQIGGMRIGGLIGGLGGLGGLLGNRLAPQTPSPAPGLTGLPPVVLREGRVYIGPIRLPLPPLAPLY